MTTETVLTDEEIDDILWDNGRVYTKVKADICRAIEKAVLQSEQVQAWKRDAERLDWLADPNNNIGNVQLPTECVIENAHSLRAAIDAAMEKQS